MYKSAKPVLMKFRVRFIGLVVLQDNSMITKTNEPESGENRIDDGGKT
jgi:hypothetical protein